MSLLHEDRLFPVEPATRKIAKRLYVAVKDLPIVSPHGHTQAAWFARNAPFPIRQSSLSNQIIMFSGCSTAKASRSMTSKSARRS